MTFKKLQDVFFILKNKKVNFIKCQNKVKKNVKNIFFKRGKLTQKEFLKIKKNVVTILSSS